MLRSIFKFYLILFFILLYIHPSQAQHTGSALGIGIKGGLATYQGDLSDASRKGHFGLSVYRWFNDAMALGSEIGYTNLVAEKDAAYFQTDLFYLSLDLKAKLYRRGPIQPYALAGIEGFKFNPRDRNDKRLANNAASEYSRFQFGFQIGAGLSIYLSPNFSVDLQAIYHPTLTDYLDDIKRGSANDTYLTTAIRLTMYFEGEQDSDEDGILDELDRCPGEKEDFDGFQDEDGCPDPDNDNDGILDVKDKCPNRAEDIDNFQDKDGCPDQDNDNDGIPDIKDKCPGTDETAANKTNTSEDFDGFQDEDGCPDPDNDGDGIPDVKDKCPNTPETFNGWEDEDGCPDEVPKIKVEVGKSIILKGVYFKTGSAELDPNSEDILEDVFETMKDNPQIRVEIRGHTDNTGTRKRNLELSLQRAHSVKEYLVKKGIDPARATTKGLGPDQPVAPNDTKDGRARNRRIEFYRVK